jgi:2-polyprenyl-3-methyl-5-hydroxy-6-metoxy-1,4-benzoquinol methylase
MAIEPYPYARREIEEFFRSHARITIGYAKVERALEDFGHYLCEMVIRAGEDRLLLQGIQFSGNRFRYPAHLDGIPSGVRNTLEKEILSRLIQNRVVESDLADAELAYTGERIVPATAPFHAYWMHARRYEFAARQCKGKSVLDAGCGCGYGTRILAQEASYCHGVDLSPQAIELANALFRHPSVEFSVGDICRLDHLADRSFDAVVALEVLEHLAPESVPAFLEKARGLLRDTATFIVSVANSDFSTSEVNPYHLSEMTFDRFRALLETSFKASSIRYFGQDVWEGSYRLDRECRILPIRGSADQQVYLAVAEVRGPGQTGPP